MESIILIVVIGILIFVSSFISNNAKLFDRRKGVEKMITQQGYIVIAINLVVILLSLWQYDIAEQKQLKSTLDAKIESNYRDSTLRSDYSSSVERISKNYDSNTRDLKMSYDTSTQNIVGALARYGLRYEKKQDSIVSLLNNTPNPKPIFQLEPGKEIVAIDTLLNKVGFTLQYKSSDAGSTNYKIFVYLVTVHMDGTLQIPFKFSPIPESLQLGTNQGWIQKFQVTKPFKEIYILMKGSYTNLDGTKRYNVNTLYSYNYITKESGSPLGDPEREIKQFIAKFYK